MLNDQARKKAEELLKIISDEISGKDTYSLPLGDIEWLAVTLIEVDNRMVEHRDCCLPNRLACAFTRRSIC